MPLLLAASALLLLSPARPLDAAPRPPCRPGGPEGQERATVPDLVAAMECAARESAEAPAVRADFDRLVASQGLEGGDAQLQDYARLRLVFESARDGGLFGVRWSITDREPTSRAVWDQWAALDPRGGVASYLTDHPSADAECDELSALCAFLARKLGVDGVGLFWPSGNHTVAVWTTRGRDGKPRRVVLPTSQVFLGADDTLGTDGFDPFTQRTIYTYEKVDVPDTFALPRELLDAFVAAMREGAALPADELQARRNARARAVGGS